MKYRIEHCWGYVIEDDEGEHLDSCRGFIGRQWCEEAARESLAIYIADAKRERVERLKTMIRNRVPLDLRCAA
jgi:hypothetical protein|tara:strand:+ start:210 stop:428 length:219 start_codon:yes stop_codon:yes gene_type:complete